jgi:DNA-binding CsgD family transcriptional regulator
MTGNNSYYKLFINIIEKYSVVGFDALEENDPVMIELDEIMKKNDQFFYIGDLILFNILYTSPQSIDVLGIAPENLTSISFYNQIHPSEIERHNLGRTMLMKIAHNLMSDKKGFRILSSNYLMKNAQGKYSNFLMQFYIFFSDLPYQSVFTLKVQTNIDRFAMPNKGFHYYLGDDLSNFRYPDKELLLLTNLYSKREFEILKLLEQGCNTEQIAQKLFLSPNTVNTHRRNILTKSGKSNMAELIHNLKEQGML